MITVSLGSAGALAGGNRSCVACSNAYARPISRGWLNARLEKVTPAGPSFALNPSGNGGSTTFWNVPPLENHRNAREGVMPAPFAAIPIAVMIAIVGFIERVGIERGRTHMR